MNSISRQNATTYELGVIAYQGHSATVSLFRDGQVIWAQSGERKSRIKEDSNLPVSSIETCLSDCKINWSDINHVYFAWKPWQSVYFNLIQNWKGLNFDFLFKKRINGDRSRLKKFNEILQVKSKLLKKFGSGPDFKFVDHHTAHAAVALAQSGYKKSLGLVIDGTGERSTISLYKMNERSIELLKETPFPHSIGCFFSAFTQFLGFQADMDEYKVMGLASYGRPIHLDKIKKLISFDNGQLVRLNLDYFLHHKRANALYTSKLTELLGDPKKLSFEEKANIASSVQAAFIDVVKEIVTFSKLKYGSETDSICFSGGVFQNCALNRVIRQTNEFKNMSFCPLCSDLGTSLGSVIAMRIEKGQNFSPVGSLFLGEEFDSQKIEQEIKKSGLEYRKITEPSILAAELLAKGNIIGWFQGRSELGPRALGNRSILADPRNPETQKLVNSKIKNREGFRPFSPAILEEDASLFFDFAPEANLKHMIELVDVKKDVADQIPAVVHVDSTARLQTVSDKDNHLFYNVLKEFKKLTGIGILLNTSFNVKDEPIVNSPEEALNTFQKANLDYLIMGSFCISAQSKEHDKT